MISYFQYPVFHESKCNVWTQWNRSVTLLERNTVQRSGGTVTKCWIYCVRMFVFLCVCLSVGLFVCLSVCVSVEHERVYISQDDYLCQACTHTVNLQQKTKRRHLESPSYNTLPDKPISLIFSCLEDTRDLLNASMVIRICCDLVIFMAGINSA